MRADACDFSLHQTFPLVIAPFRVCQQFATMDEQLSFLHNVVRHLAPGGRFIFDVFNPNFAALVQNRTAETVDTVNHPFGDGRLVSRAFAFREFGG